MSWKIIAFLAFCSIFSAHAGFSSLLQEFKEKNIDLKNYQSQVELSHFDKEIIKATKTWTLTGEGAQSDNKMDASSNVNSLQTKMTAYTLGVTKSFGWGGAFSFENKLGETDRSRWGELVLGNRPVNIYEFTQTISYSQNLWKDFFGRGYYAQLDVAQKTIEKTEMERKKQSEDRLYTFFSAYLDARLTKTLLRLQSDAMIRVLKRKNNISKRVKDGLSERVDLHRAEGSFLQQKEALNENEVDLQKALETLASHLHRPIKENELDELPFNTSELPEVKTGQIQENLNLKTLKMQLEVIDTNLKRLDYNFAPSLKLTGSLSTNDYDAKRSRTFSQGNLFQQQREIAFALNLSLPLGFESENAQYEKEKINQMIAQRSMEALEKNLSFIEMTLEKQVSGLKRNYQLAQQRRTLSERTLQGQNRLYNLGRSDLDSVIFAEENLITTEKGLVTYLNSYFKALALKAQVYGKLWSFVENFEK